MYEYATIRMGKEVEGMNGLKIKRTEVEEFKKYLIMEEKSKINIKNSIFRNSLIFQGLPPIKYQNLMYFPLFLPL